VEHAAEGALLRRGEHRPPGRGHGVDDHVDGGPVGDVVRQRHAGDRRPVGTAAEVLRELARLEEGQHRARGDLEEDDLAGDVQQRAPAQPVDVEAPRRVEVGGGQGDDVDLLFHGDLRGWPRPASRRERGDVLERPPFRVPRRAW
jgi:hypothetical protein